MPGNGCDMVENTSGVTVMMSTKPWTLSYSRPLMLSEYEDGDTMLS